MAFFCFVLQSQELHLTAEARCYSLCYSWHADQSALGMNSRELKSKYCILWELQRGEGAYCLMEHPQRLFGFGLQ